MELTLRSNSMFMWQRQTRIAKLSEYHQWIKGCAEGRERPTVRPNETHADHLMVDPGCLCEHYNLQQD